MKLKIYIYILCTIKGDNLRVIQNIYNVNDDDCDIDDIDFKYKF